jgi:hypothetical protein
MDINSASVAELRAIGGLDVAQASAIVEARPLRNWEELAHVPGFDGAAISRLKAGRLEIRTLQWRVFFRPSTYKAENCTVLIRRHLKVTGEGLCYSSDLCGSCIPPATLLRLEAGNIG